MIGFENYIPNSWLSGKSIAVGVAMFHAKPSAKPAFRRGRWASAAIAAGLAVATVFSVLSFLPTSIVGAASHEAASGASADQHLVHSGAYKQPSRTVNSGVARARTIDRAPVVAPSQTHVDSLLAKLDRRIGSLFSHDTSDVNPEVLALAEKALSAMNQHGDPHSTAVWKRA